MATRIFLLELAWENNPSSTGPNPFIFPMDDHVNRVCTLLDQFNAFCSTTRKEDTKNNQGKEETPLASTGATAVVIEPEVECAMNTSKSSTMHHNMTIGVEAGKILMAIVKKAFCFAACADEYSISFSCHQSARVTYTFYIFQLPQNYIWWINLTYFRH